MCGSMEMIFALSLLLAAGFATARLVKLIKLPAVTGYILAGLVLGPSGLHVIGAEFAENRLVIFTNIAMLLVAFGIGERFDLQQLRRSKKVVFRVSLGESAGAFVLVLVGITVAAGLSGAGGPGANLGWWLALGLMAAAISVETAAASTVAVLREIVASGPTTRLLLSNVVVNNALAVTLFGFALTASRALLETDQGPGWTQILVPIGKTLASLLLGVVIGFLTDVLVHRLTQRNDVLIVALAAVFFCGGLADFLGLSPLLAGLAAGFAVVNRDRRDVRAFRALNDFEPPIYGIFFALAGVQLHLSELASAGLLAAVYIVARAAGKYFGARWGALSAGYESARANLVGLGLLPQAGLAIALAYVIRQDPTLDPIRSVLLNVIIASVVVNELVGPPLVSLMAHRTGEVPTRPERPAKGNGASPLCEVRPWEGPLLESAEKPDGFVLFGLSHPGRVEAVTRIGTLLSHRFSALPMAVRIVSGSRQDDFWSEGIDREARRLFDSARRGAQSMGYPLETYSDHAEETSEGIIRAAELVHAHAIVLGHPLAQKAPEFARIVDAVAKEADCPVVVAKLTGELLLRRILVPISSLSEFGSVLPLVEALDVAPDRQITLLWLMPPETSPNELEKGAERLRQILKDYLPEAQCRAVAAESRVHAILEASQECELVVMSASDQRGLRRVFFGSLAEDVAVRIDRPILMVRGALEDVGPRNGAQAVAAAEVE